jgi:antitoxin MazE
MERTMQIAKWGNSLAVRLPKDVVDILRLKEGDDVEITVTGQGMEVTRKPLPREILARLRKYRGRMPEGFKFDREEAHERR